MPSSRIPARLSFPACRFFFCREVHIIVDWSDLQRKVPAGRLVVGFGERRCCEELRGGAQVLPPLHQHPQVRPPVRRIRDLDWGATEMRKDKARTAQVKVNGYEHHNPLRGCWLIRIPNSQTRMLRCPRYGSSPQARPSGEHVKGAVGHDEAVNCHTGH